MENALKEWSLIFDDASYSIWNNSPPKLALIQVMFHNLMKQLLILQQTSNQNFSERVITQISDNSIRQTECTPKKNSERVATEVLDNSTRQTERTLKNNIKLTVKTKPKENLDISDVDSPDPFTDISVLSPSDANTTDSIFNRNVVDNVSPAPEEGIVIPSILFSPTINRRKSNKKKKLDYPELNTTEKNMFQDSMSTTFSQSSLIDFTKNINLSKKQQVKDSVTSDICSNAADKPLRLTKNSPESKSDEKNETFHTQNLSRIQKRIQNLKSVAPKSTKDQQVTVRRVNFKAAEDTKDITLVSGDANKFIDATMLLSCPVASALNDTSFLEIPKERTTKPIFLSKWEQRRLQEEDVDEQNCSRCGNFRGFKDLSPTMCGTKNYKCPKHRKKYMRLNTPDAIWNLDFPDDSE